jgi:hypothetical protein
MSFWLGNLHGDSSMKSIVATEHCIFTTMTTTYQSSWVHNVEKTFVEGHLQWT